MEFQFFQQCPVMLPLNLKRSRSLLPLARQYRRLSTKNERLMKSFYPEAI